MSQPNVYDTTGLGGSDFTQMAQLLAADINNPNSPGYSIIGPNSAQLQNAAFAINGNQIAGTNQLAAVPVTAPNTSAAGNPTQSQSTWDNILDVLSHGGGASSFATGPAEQAAAAGGQQAAGGSYEADPIQGSVDAGKSGVAALSPTLAWIQAHAGNYGIIILGAVLAVGALLISQRKTIINVAKTAAEVAA